MSQVTRPVIFGEVLFDCFPDGREVLGGAPFNVAWNLQAFEMKPVFISRVGEDAMGHLIREKMNSWGMDTAFLQLDMNWPTGRVEITLAEGEPKFAILPNQAYDHISSLMPPIEGKPAFLYHGSLALRDDKSRNSLLLLKRKSACPVFLDINLRRPWWNRETVFSLIEDATWLKMNDDELRLLFPDQQDLNSSCKTILDKFKLDTVFLTMGSRGAIAFTHDAQPCMVKPLESIEVMDTVGAGDAFSSILLIGLMQDWPIQTSMNRAQEFASAIVTQRGATVQDRGFYTKFKDKWLPK